MSSTIPTRRPIRTTRATSVKENENVNPRPTRASTRSKPPSTASGTTGALGGVTRATAASRAKSNGVPDSKVDIHAGKRKREALGEVTIPNNKLAPVAGKGKEKETFDGVVIKTKAIVVRQPLRTVAGTRQTTSTVVTKKQSTKDAKPSQQVVALDDENAMIVDPPAPLLSITARKSDVIRQSRRISLRSAGILPLLPEDDPASIQPAHKKRRTSSVGPEDVLHVTEEDRLEIEEDIHNARVAAEMEAFANEEEADPEGMAWDDLDADDSDDPLMVSEYVHEIFDYLRQVEQTIMPNPNYMESQKELAWKMRGILTDWLIQVHVRFRLLPETLFLCVNIVDRFLSTRVVSLAKLQLVGVTCLFIAAKFEEIVAPSVTHFLLCADASYTEAEILMAERYVLKTLDWNLSYPNPVHFLRRISKADEYNVKVRTLAKYLLEIGVVEWRLIAAPPSVMAASAIWLARLALGFEQWTPNLAHFSSYRESDLVPTANLMLNYILKPTRHESFHKKYAGKRYYKASLYMRTWAFERWEEDSQVDLSQDLLRLKALIKLDRLAEEAFHVEEEEA